MLTQAQVAQYRHDGYFFPSPALSPTELAECNQGLARYEAWLGTPVNRADRRWRSAAYVMLPWYDALVRHPRILDVVEDLIGPDILVYTATFFIKEANSPTFAAWHQDATYFGLEPKESVCAWVALTDASQEAGCMEALSSRGAPRQFRHAALRLEHSINRAGQTIVEALDDSSPIAMSLPAGSFSLHHELAVHRSAPNHAAHRRIGIGLNYIPTHVCVDGLVRLRAMLVRGRDTYGHFDLIEPPSAERDAAALAVHLQVSEAYGRNYNEQVRRHEGRFAVGA